MQSNDLRIMPQSNDLSACQLNTVYRLDRQHRINWKCIHMEDNLKNESGNPYDKK